MHSLVLFDIDGTLLRTEGAGVGAMVSAGQELFGERFNAEGIDFAGSLDAVLVREMLTRCGAGATPTNERAFRARYAEHLRARLAASRTARALVGAVELVHAVRSRNGHTAGLLTGNYAETGALKLAACGLDPAWFRVCAWGDDSPHDPADREHLPPVAMERYRVLAGSAIDPARVTIIGDTVHDVRCARANGCRSIGVATGRYTVEELWASGADHVVPDLSGTSDMLSWIAMTPSGPRGLS